MLRRRGVSTLLLEPSRSNLRGPTHSPSSPSSPPLRSFRLIAAASAATVVLGSKGDVVILVALLGLVAFNRRAALGLGACGASMVVLYGSGSLSAMAGSQSVLGPAGLNGPPSVTVSVWFAAAAILIATFVSGSLCQSGDPQTLLEGKTSHRIPWVVAIAHGGSASLLVMGPSASRGILVRMAAIVTATLLIRFAWRFVQELSIGKMTTAVAGFGATSLVLAVISTAAS